jgi:glycosyltransferase involved in cell wall biosynthesis
MRIAILNWRDRANPSSGGAEIYCHEVASRWATSGHSVSLYTSRVRGLPAKETCDGVRVVRVGRLRNGTHHLLAPTAMMRSGEPTPDVVLESINTIPYMLPLRRGLPPFLPLVHQMAVDVWDSHFPGPLAALARKLERALLRAYRNTPTVCISNSTKSDLVRAGLRNLDEVPVGGIGLQLPLEKLSTPTFLFVGRLTENKRPGDALEAFRAIKTRLPDSRLWIIGEGRLRHALADDLPAGAELLGHVEREELLTRMSRAHVLLVTSVREGWGLVVTEAAALGTPAVAYDVPGLRDSVLHRRTGLLTEPRPEALADSALSLMRDPLLYASVRTGAIDWGARFSWKTAASELLVKLERLANGLV